MKITPWRNVKTWQCYGCGDVCCSSPIVPLTLDEWLKITGRFGPEYTEFNVSGFYLKCNPNGCVFRFKLGDKHLCLIQDIKPKACKLWPFKVYKKPLYGFVNESTFTYGGENLHVYLDTKCKGIVYGKPSEELTKKIIPEFIEIMLDKKVEQVYSTGRFPVKTKIFRTLYL
ncbi:MAG: YkgJ family cysteine cluster protein [Candidatus Bathyarchaeota archaeon]|nr:YkgJ family cysteine cluster protein [Candidatus Bathyarchaeota archaeon]